MDIDEIDFASRKAEEAYMIFFSLFFNLCFILGLSWMKCEMECLLDDLI